MEEIVQNGRKNLLKMRNIASIEKKCVEWEEMLEMVKEFT